MFHYLLGFVVTLIDTLSFILIWSGGLLVGICLTAALLGLEPRFLDRVVHALSRRPWSGLVVFVTFINNNKFWRIVNLSS